MKRVRALGLVAAAIALATAGATAAHVRWARRTSTLGAASGGCPFGKTGDSAEREQGRVAAMLTLRGHGVAPSRALLGLEVGSSTRADVTRFSSARGLQCASDVDPAALRCVDRSDDRARERADDAGVRDFVFRFSPNDTLVAVDAVGTKLTPAEAVASLERLRKVLAPRLGDALVMEGGQGERYLVEAPFRREAVSARYEDWALDVSATSTAGQGVTLRLQSRFLR